MKFIIQNLCEDGTGYFMSEIIKEIKRKNLTIKLIEFNPWNDIKEEINKINNELALNNFYYKSNSF